MSCLKKAPQKQIRIPAKNLLYFFTFADLPHKIARFLCFSGDFHEKVFCSFTLHALFRRMRNN